MGDTLTDVNANNSLKRPDFNSPFYLHPSENATSTLLPVVFDGTSYRSWRRAVLRALSVKNKTGFINGKIVKPSFTDPSFMQWERCDDMVTSWILNSLSPELRDSLQYVNNAKELWEELEDRYDQTNGCKLYQLQKEINDLVQGTLDITGYCTKMKKLWEEMSAIDVNSQCSCVCTCGGKVKLYKAEQDRRLIHFLMGLNEMYTAVRGNILMMSTLPTMAQAFAILSQEERQREMKPLNHMALEYTSLNVSMLSQNNATNSSSYRGSTSRGNGSYNNTGSFNNNSTGNFNNTNTYRGNSNIGNRSNMFCEYCKRTEHVKDRCFKLHGYPSNTRNPRGRGKGSAANVHTSEGDGNKCEENFEQEKQMPVNLSKGQYEQLLNLLGNMHGGAESDYLNCVSSVAASLAGIFACHSSISRIGDMSCRCEKLTAGSWIIDSGASHHMTYTKHNLTNLKSLPYPFLITLPNGYKVKVTEFGDVCLNPTLILYKVLYIPSFKFNLISVYCLANQLKGVVSFNNGSCLLQGPSLKCPLALGKAKNSLYFFCPKCHILSANDDTGSQQKFQSVSLMNYCKGPSLPNAKQSHIINKKVCSTNKISNSAAHFSFNQDNEFLWHARLVHVPFVKMKDISTIPLKFSNKQPFTCTIYPMARQTRMLFPESVTTTSSIFELLHVDLWGPYNVPTHDGYHYFLTMVDDYSRATWTQLIRCKSNALCTIKAFISLIENQFHTKLKTIRSDNGLEFSSTEATCFFQEKGIVHQKSCPYTPQQNGVVERKHKYLLETARALLFQSKLPIKYWGECILTATYIINRLPSAYLHNKCPFTILYNQEPQYSHMRSFGCLCFPTTHKHQRTKFEPRATPHVFLG